MKKILLSIFACFFVISCASVSVNTKDISNLKDRIDAFYSAKIAHDYKEAFRYENMSLNEQFTVGYYITNAAKSPVELLDVSVISIDLNESKDVAMVKMELKYKLLPIKGFEKFDQVQERIVEDKWVYKEGNWYHIIQGITRDW